MQELRGEHEVALGWVGPKVHHVPEADPCLLHPAPAVHLLGQRLGEALRRLPDRHPDGASAGRGGSGYLGIKGRGKEEEEEERNGEGECRMRDAVAGGGGGAGAAVSRAKRVPGWPF